MRDHVLERSPYWWSHRRSRWIRDPRCPVCRAVPRMEYTMTGTNPLGGETRVTTCSSHYCRSRAYTLAFWPVDQTTFGYKLGNCFSAVVAMLLGLDIDAVPYFMTGDWYAGFKRWLADRGFRPDYYGSRDWCAENNVEYREPPRGFSILSGESPRWHKTEGTPFGRTVYHSVLAFDGRCVHDPNPHGRLEVATTLDYITIVPLESGAS